MIELLVVIGIIGILASLLLPALARSKRKSREIICLNNQKQLALALHLYAGDFRDWIQDTHATTPPKKSPNDNPGTGGGYWPIYLGDDATVLEITTQTKVEEALEVIKRGIKAGPLWKYCNAFQTYHCPSDLRTKDCKPGKGWAYDSYTKLEGMNGATFGMKGVKARLEWRAYATFAEISNPALTAAFLEESDPRDFNNGVWWFDRIKTTGWVDPFAVNHGPWSTFGFADGHAEGRKWTDADTIKAAADSAQGIYRFFREGGTVTNKDWVWTYERFRFADWTPLPQK